MSSVRRLAIALALITAFGIVAAPAPPALAETTLKVVMHSDLKIVDPIWTTAYIVRNHGYMVYDTLFAMDAKGEVRPQMVDKYDVSADRLTYTMTLRDGLLWHDGKPVTAEDCVASIKRWAAKDSMAQKMMGFVKELQVVNPKTFRIVLKEPTGLVLGALGKPSSNVPFMMPKRVAETDPNTQISDFTGSGPFVFKKEEWKPGDKAVYVKFGKYKPRPEPASGLAGGKVVKVDRVEWKWIPDHQTAINALLAGEVDYLESPPHDLYPVLKQDANVRLVSLNPLGNQYTFRFNSIHKPFDNVKVRQAVFYAFNQEDFLKAVIGDPAFYKTCKSFFPCGSPLATTKGMDGLLESNFEKARGLLKEAGYDGTPVILMHSTDLAVLANLAPVAKSLMERAGFKVDMHSMDWQTLVSRRAKKDLPAQGGWNAFLTSWVSADILNPVMMGFMNASCDKAMFGWPCDKEIESLRDQFARETDPAKQKAIAEAVQVRETHYPTHLPLGQWYGAVAVRKNVGGMIEAPVTVFWNVEKKGR
ncbi:MAG: ABC transporter substrate-binding protein [Candidatus Rokubacteria bacterium RIFCSPLOWO2_12_FULL_71_22]|nr:MAG: ABC transporter substrate-binding protein [Candidatus Rokubacteria bacterium RIFCSPLOWO2_12_FULL_71_22]